MCKICVKLKKSAFVKKERESRQKNQPLSLQIACVCCIIFYMYVLYSEEVCNMADRKQLAKV